MALELGDGDIRGGGVEIVHDPVFDSGFPIGEELPHEGAVFRFLEGDDAVGALKVGAGELDRLGAGVVQRDAAGGQSDSRKR